MFFRFRNGFSHFNFAIFLSLLLLDSFFYYNLTIILRHAANNSMTVRMLASEWIFIALRGREGMKFKNRYQIKLFIYGKFITLSLSFSSFAIFFVGNISSPMLKISVTNFENCHLRRKGEREG